ncbi:hypothetical protein P5G61_05350 [Paenibacillus sp. F6_3S_P_1C]|uniref:Uncharacterized protein n=1 Tax=Paenibacillus vandeheii TaxID=3035917 RepID=A0ABT8J6C6_9BACL|nr:hypothetical protein [Paenibacillus vandeheii]MDN4600642.1 hypothetical protein [Paenibacillus vandeheii]
MSRYRGYKLTFHLPASLIVMQNALVRKKAASALHIAAYLLINFFPTDLSIVIYIKIAVADLEILRIRLTFNQIQHPISALVRPDIPGVPHRWSFIHTNDVQPFIPLNVMPLINVF